VAPTAPARARRYTRMAGRDGDPMELYQVFQSSYNKITKTDYAAAAVDTAAASGAAAFNSADMYAADSRFFPFDTRPGAGGGAIKCDKTEMSDPRQWYADPSSGGMYSDPALYYAAAAQDQEWGASTAAYHPHAHYSPDPALYANAAVGAYGGGAVSAAVSPPVAGGSPGPYGRGSVPPLDETVNLFRNHLDFSQVPVIIFFLKKFKKPLGTGSCRF